VVHGQMTPKEIEAAMARFIRREDNVLVSTTIIGSGLDIPTANTIIINRADRFGLAQLYQIRGRVGRSDVAELRGGRILLIDDDEDILKVLGKVLTAEKFELDVASSGREAILKLGREDYDLILSDIRMPELDGKQLFAFLEQNMDEYRRKVIFLTGDTGNPETMKFLEQTGCPYLTKPIEIPTLIRLTSQIFLQFHKGITAWTEIAVPAHAADVGKSKADPEAQGVPVAQTHAHADLAHPGRPQLGLQGQVGLPSESHALKLRRQEEFAHIGNVGLGIAHVQTCQAHDVQGEGFAQDQIVQVGLHPPGRQVSAFDETAAQDGRVLLAVQKREKAAVAFVHGLNFQGLGPGHGPGRDACALKGIRHEKGGPRPP